MPYMRYKGNTDNINRGNLSMTRSMIHLYVLTVKFYGILRQIKTETAYVRSTTHRPSADSVQVNADVEQMSTGKR